MISTYCKRWRIVKDNYSGYEVQVWRIWFPFWIQPTVNTHVSVENARQWAIKEASNNNVVVEFL